MKIFRTIAANSASPAPTITVANALTSLRKVPHPNERKIPIPQIPDVERIKREMLNIVSANRVIRLTSLCKRATIRDCVLHYSFDYSSRRFVIRDSKASDDPISEKFWKLLRHPY